MNRIATIAALCALAFAGLAGADEKLESGKEVKADQAPYSDRMFFEKAAVGGMAEVQAGEMATTKGNSDDVRSFGRKMVADHGRKNAELEALAAKKNVTLPTKLDAKHQDMVAKLDGMNGDAFDRAYAQDMVKGHEDMAALLERAAKESGDADVRKFASDTLSAVHQHHELALKMQKTEMAEATND